MSIEGEYFIQVTYLVKLGLTFEWHKTKNGMRPNDNHSKHSKTTNLKFWLFASR